MARINPAKRQLTVKVVYYGAGLSGKTTNLTHLHEAYPNAQRGPLVQLDTESERTLFFDYFPAKLGKIAGYTLKADFFTVPGQSFYNATRRAVLEGADGIVFVADSQRSREEANVVALENLIENLSDHGRQLRTIPHLLQWNKRDVRNPLPVDVLDKVLNRFDAPTVEAEAVNGNGVWETQAAILKSVVTDIHARAREGRLGA